MASEASGFKPRVILGLMTFGPGGRVSSMDEFKGCLDYLQAQGYNEVDTAHSYVNKQQQAFTREAQWKQRGLKLATKYYPSEENGGHTAANLRDKLETNLRELGTDCVDIFYLHAPDRGTNFAETMEACNELHKDGKFVQLGLSCFTAFEVAECVMICNERGWVRPTIYQGRLNAITRDLEQETVIACHRYGLDVVVFNPIAGGLLSGKIMSPYQVPEDSSRFGTLNKSGGVYRRRYFKEGTFEAMKLIERAAKKYSLTMVEIALRWVVHHSSLNCRDNGGDGIIIGVSSVSQLKANLADLEKGPLPEYIVQTLDEAWLLCKAHTGNYWHGELKYRYDTKTALFRTTAV